MIAACAVVLIIFCGLPSDRMVSMIMIMVIHNCFLMTMVVAVIERGRRVTGLTKTMAIAVFNRARRQGAMAASR
jgi:hypothetical protein